MEPPAARPPLTGSPSAMNLPAARSRPVTGPPRPPNHRPRSHRRSQARRPLTPGAHGHLVGHGTTGPPPPGDPRARCRPRDHRPSRHAPGTEPPTARPRTVPGHGTTGRPAHTLTGSPPATESPPRPTPGQCPPATEPPPPPGDTPSHTELNPKPSSAHPQASPPTSRNPPRPPDSRKPRPPTWGRSARRGLGTCWVDPYPRGERRSCTDPRCRTGAEERARWFPYRRRIK